ncbi:fam-a protein [Plasmodium chabaudi chabaudi]|uniref:Fam-a protein n=1 Tax=Plasmodium chabaudi chabaudi TaxID=31271 RepID=A0A1C6WL28_PLACU|nr:fam-a protein [Plasmodium chabaudi chabaudi]
MSKGYFKIIFSLLISSLYMSNKALAGEPDSGIGNLRKFARPSTIPNSANNDSEETNEKRPFNLIMGIEETKIAEQVMDEAEMLLQYHAVNMDGYKVYHRHSDDTIQYYKKHGNTTIHKYNHQIRDSNRYNAVINMIWDPNNVQTFDDKVIKEKDVCEYSPNLKMIQARYTNESLSFHGYYYALSKKIQVSDDTTIIVYTSSDADDYNDFDRKKYTNPIVESANLFKPRIYSENDIINGELTKIFVNLSGYVIKKIDDYVDITYVNSISVNADFFEDSIARIINSAHILNFMKLSTTFYKE